MVRAYDGMNAWWQLPLTVTPQYPLTATLLEGQKFDATMAFPWKIRYVLHQLAGELRSDH